jgi:rhodanese-related sulfurtransferase
MKSTTLRALLIGTLTWSATACDQPGPTAPVAPPKEVTVPELAEMLSGRHPPAVFDANDDQVRTELGLIPGAVPLPERKFDTESVLPNEKGAALVFYCSGKRCQSAEGAARRALAAGYRDVAVLPAGIRGWKDAGERTEPYRVPGG